MRDPTHLFEGEVSPERYLLARRVSVALQPTIITIPVFMLLCIPLLPDAADYMIAVLVTTVFLSILPTILVYYFSYKTNNIDGDVEKREERMAPLIIGVLLYVLAGVAIMLVEAPDLVRVFTWTYVISTFVVTLISTKWKISIHMTGITGPVIALTVAFFPWGIVSAVLLPIVGWSRYVQRKHTPAQLAGGVIEGIIVTLLMFTLFLW